jgi:hypothetical protein
VKNLQWSFGERRRKTMTKKTQDSDAIDVVFRSFLARQFEEGMKLASSSDLLDLVSLGESPPDRYVAVFRCKGLVLSPQSVPVEADRFHVGIWFPSDYLRRADPFQVLTWLQPAEVFHPNIKSPAVCIGPIAPGTTLVNLLYRLFEVVTFREVTTIEDNALDLEACAWVRRTRHLFPVDRRPLKWRASDSDHGRA